MLCDVGGSPALQHAFQGARVGLDVTPGQGLHVGGQCVDDESSRSDVQELRDAERRRNSKERDMISEYAVYQTFMELF